MIVLPNAAQVLLAANALPIAVGANISMTEADVFSSSVEFKLQCAEHYLERLKETLKPIPVRALARGGGPNLFLVNLYLDGFLATTVSASDVFGHEINIYYGKSLPNRFYLYDLVNHLHTNGRAPALVAHLQPALDYNAAPLPLIPRLKKYRNCSSHRRLIETATVISGTVTYGQQRTGAAMQFKHNCYLPDDPEQVPCAYTQNIDLLTFCEQSLINLTGLLNDAYLRVLQAMGTAAQLPL